VIIFSTTLLVATPFVATIFFLQLWLSLQFRCCNYSISKTLVPANSSTPFIPFISFPLPPLHSQPPFLSYISLPFPCYHFTYNHSISHNLPFLPLHHSYVATSDSCRCKSTCKLISIFVAPHMLQLYNSHFYNPSLQ
jgi:hypothetical protein